MILFLIYPVLMTGFREMNGLVRWLISGYDNSSDNTGCILTSDVCIHLSCSLSSTVVMFTVGQSLGTAGTGYKAGQ